MSILGFSIVGNPKMTFIFILGYPNPRKGVLRGGGSGGIKGVLSPTLPHIMCYVNSGIFNSGEFKNDLRFHFRVPHPPQGRPQGGGGPWGHKGGVENPRIDITHDFW